MHLSIEMTSEIWTSWSLTWMAFCIVRSNEMEPSSYIVVVLLRNRERQKKCTGSNASVMKRNLYAKFNQSGFRNQGLIWINWFDAVRMTMNGGIWSIKKIDRLNKRKQSKQEQRLYTKRDPICYEWHKFRACKSWCKFHLKVYLSPALDPIKAMIFYHDRTCISIYNQYDDCFNRLVYVLNRKYRYIWK